MTNEEIDSLSKDAVLDLMRSEGLPVEHGLFATIHFRSPDRPDGFTDDDMDSISAGLENQDLVRWRKQLRDHFGNKKLLP